MRRDHVLQFVLEAAQTPDFQGVTAQAVADALSIWRNDAAVELNKLVAEGKLRRSARKTCVSSQHRRRRRTSGRSRPCRRTAAGRGGDRAVPAFSGLVRRGRAA